MWKGLIENKQSNRDFFWLARHVACEWGVARTQMVSGNFKKNAILQPTTTDGNVWDLTMQRVPICLCLRACAGDDIVSPGLADADDYAGVDA